MELTIEKLVYGGDGLARDGGRVVFVPYTLAGERVVITAEPGRGGLLRGAVRDILAPSPDRAAPPCPYFGSCGGCHYQHAGYQRQLDIKRDILRETLRRVGKFEAPEEIAVIAADPWGYRNRAQFHIEDSSIGYLKADSRQLCPISQCPISSPRVNETLTALACMLRDSRWPRFVRSIEVFTNEAETQINVLESDRPVARRFFDWCAEAIPGFTAGALDYSAAGFLFRVSGGSFFQVNRFLIDRLVESATGAEGDWALDLYAGVGLFSLPLARRFRKVTSVESGALAVRDLRFNAARADVSPEIVQSATEEYLRNLDTAPDFVLADPPRAGLGRGVVAKLAALQPRRITIVSCDPATLARDLPGLLSEGYRIDRLTLADLFPQTFHLETIVTLTRDATS